MPIGVLAVITICLIIVGVVFFAIKSKDRS